MTDHEIKEAFNLLLYGMSKEEIIRFLEEFSKERYEALLEEADENFRLG